MSSHSSWSKAASRTYRPKNLERAGIYLEEHLRFQDWPPSILNFANFLEAERFTSIISAEQIPWFDDSLQPIPQHSIAPVSTLRACDAQAFVACQSLSEAIQNLQSRTEPRWLRASAHLFEVLHTNRSIARSENELWDAPVELLQGEGSPLSTPKPNYSFGLETDRSAPFPTAWMDPRSAPVLSDAFLTHLQMTTGLQPWLATGIVDMVFPCIVYEGKSDSSTLFFAENQVAGAAARALVVLEELCVRGICQRDMSEGYVGGVAGLRLRSVVTGLRLDGAVGNQLRSAGVDRLGKQGRLWLRLSL